MTIFSWNVIKSIRNHYSAIRPSRFIIKLWIKRSLMVEDRGNDFMLESECIKRRPTATITFFDTFIMTLLIVTFNHRHHQSSNWSFITVSQLYQSATPMIAMKGPSISLLTVLLLAGVAFGFFLQPRVRNLCVMSSFPSVKSTCVKCDASKFSQMVSQVFFLSPDLT